MFGTGLRRVAWRYGAVNETSASSIWATQADLLIIQAGDFSASPDTYASRALVSSIKNQSGASFIGAYVSVGRKESIKDFSSSLTGDAIFRVRFGDEYRDYFDYTKPQVLDVMRDELRRLIDNGFDVLFLDDLDSFRFLTAQFNTGADDGLRNAIREIMKYTVTLSADAQAYAKSISKQIKIVGNVDSFQISDFVFSGGPLSSTDMALIDNYIRSFNGITFESQYGTPLERRVVEQINLRWRRFELSHNLTVTTINYGLNSELMSNNQSKGMFFWRALKDRILPFAARSMALSSTETSLSLVGTSGFDIMATGEGGQLLESGAGDDFLIGGYGRDTLNGGSGRDFVDGDGGQDLAVYGTAREALTIHRRHRFSWSVASADGVDELREVERVSTQSGTIALNRAEFTDLRTGDLNGDGLSDLVWRSEAGQAGFWLPTTASPNQASMSYAVSEVISPAWRIIGDADFNRDGRADLLWRHNDGTVAIWLMNGAVRQNASVYVANASTGWSIDGIDDFNGDGAADILWRETSGRLAIWGMNGTEITSTAVSPGGVSDDWEVVGTGRLRGESGKADILWFNARTREMAVWSDIAFPTFGFGFQSLSKADPMWAPIAIADFNGDGFDDILFRKDTDAAATETGVDHLRVWTSTAAGIREVADFKTRYDQVMDYPNLELTAIGDFNRDGRADLVYSRMVDAAHNSGTRPTGSHWIQYSGTDRGINTFLSLVPTAPLAAPGTWTVM